MSILENIFSKVADAISDFFRALADGIASSFWGVIGKVGDSIGAFLHDIGSALAGLGSGIASCFGNVLSSIGSFFHALGSGVASAIAAGLSALGALTLAVLFWASACALLVTMVGLCILALRGLASRPVDRARRERTSILPCHLGAYGTFAADPAWRVKVHPTNVSARGALVAHELQLEQQMQRERQQHERQQKKREQKKRQQAGRQKKRNCAPAPPGVNETASSQHACASSQCRQPCLNMVVYPFAQVDVCPLYTPTRPQNSAGPPSYVDHEGTAPPPPYQA